MVMSPTSVAHVDNGQVTVLVQGWSSLHFLAFIQLLSVQPRYRHLLDHISSGRLTSLHTIISQIRTTIRHGIGRVPTRRLDRLFHLGHSLTSHLTPDGVKQHVFLALRQLVVIGRQTPLFHVLLLTLAFLLLVLLLVLVVQFCQPVERGV